MVDGDAPGLGDFAQDEAELLKKLRTYVEEQGTLRARQLLELPVATARVQHADVPCALSSAGDVARLERPKERTLCRWHL